MKAAIRLRARTSTIVALAATIAVLSACGSSVTSGSGRPAGVDTSAAASDSSGPAESTGASGLSASSDAAGSISASPSASAQLTASINGTGTLSGSYRMTLWAHDVITDCALHSYGQPIIAYFTAHPCRSATRRLWTMPLEGRTLALSVVSVSAQVTKVNENPDFQYAQQLADLENADATGSVKDLLREGSRIPGTGPSIPANEVFSVLSQDGLVVIMDGWYTTGATNPKDAKVLAVEEDLTFSDAAAPDA